MAGTIPLSLTQQFDIYGQPLAGGQLYLIQAGTVSTPQDGFQDANLTIKMPYPITLDAAGRIPQFFLADGTIKVRLQDKSGVVQLAADSILVIGPSAGGGGGGTVDPTQLIQTGNLILRYGVGLIAGYVRLNGLSIGSATSGATERANADCQAAFQYLYVADPTLAVSGGRGASAAADWAANKQLTLPDARGRDLRALADMGNTDVGLFASVAFTKGSQTVLGSTLGTLRKSIDTTALPGHTHGIALGWIDPGHTHGIPPAGGVAGSQGSNPGAAAIFPANPRAQTDSSGTGITAYVHDGFNNHNVTASAGGGLPFDIANPSLLITAYIKL